MHDLAREVQCGTLKLYWQGGEVLSLDPRSLEKGLDIAERLFRSSGISLEHHLQTNLLLYASRKWKSVLGRFSLATISSSLDYPNLYRRGRSLAPREYAGVWLQKKQEAEDDGYSVSVVSLPNHETLKLGAERFYRYFEQEMRVSNLQVNFPFPGKDDGVQSLDLGGLARFMTDLYDVWLASNRSLNLSPFVRLEDRLLRNRGNLLCNWTYTCADSLLAVGPQGDVGQCDCWVTRFTQFNYGSLTPGNGAKALLQSPQRQRFLDRPLHLARLSRCGECRFWAICFGGCPVRAFTFTGTIESPDHYCPVYHSMFSIVSERASAKAAVEVNLEWSGDTRDEPE
jgi:radical SAM protein with 4Fe4S-binding SPASM domain